MGKKASGIAWLQVLAVCWFFFSILGRASAQSTLLHETEEVVGTLSRWADLKAYRGLQTIITTPGASRIQWWEKQGNKDVLFVDGQETAKYDSYTQYSYVKSDFSQDGKHVFVQAFQKKKVSITLDGKTLASGKAADFSDVAFSPAGELVYAQRNGKNWDVMVDGKQRWSAECDGVVAFAWPPTGEVAAFQVQDKATHSWIVNGVRGPQFGGVYHVIFSADGRYAYVGATSHMAMFSYTTKGYLVVDGKQKIENPIHDNYKELGMWAAFSPGQVLALAKDVGVGDPAFSSDGKHLGYSISIAPRQTAVVVDDVQGPVFFSIIYGPFFTSDGNHFAYLALTEEGKKLAQVYDHKIVREVSLEGFDHLGRLAKSHDLSRFAVALARRGNPFTGRGPVMHPPFKILVDGQDEGKKEYEELSELAFSPNGHHFYYYVKDKSLKGVKAHVVVDGKAGKAYEEIVPGSLAFVDETTFRYAARDGEKFFRITAKIE
ncbi:MAG: hypothetical protein ACXV5J_10850 [Candidatus Angelobacter sp.]